TILGTTDTDYHGPLDDVWADATDIGYVLQITNQFFPAAKLVTGDVISAWAGLRPLVADPSGKPSDISRAHEIHNPEPGWWDVAGGKLTTYRLMGEQTVDQIVKQLKGEATRCRTAQEPLLPVAETRGVSAILPPEFSRRAVEHYVAREWAVHLDDVMVRRTSWHWYFAEAPRMAERVADWMGELLGWSGDDRRAELERYARLTGRQMEASPPKTAAPGQQLTGRKGFPLLLRIFEPAPAMPVTLTDPAQIAVQHRYWQRRIMVATIVGYATYYFVRKNLSIALPVMEKTLGVTKADLGLFLTLHGVLYGVSKFVNGFFGDRCHVRTV